MKYVKPEVALVELAIDAIQATCDKNTTPSDGQGTVFTSPCAYEADE